MGLSVLAWLYLAPAAFLQWMPHIPGIHAPVSIAPLGSSLQLHERPSQTLHLGNLTATHGLTSLVFLEPASLPNAVTPAFCIAAEPALCGCCSQLLLQR